MFDDRTTQRDPYPKNRSQYTQYAPTAVPVFLEKIDPRGGPALNGKINGVDLKDSGATGW
jgi:hypothetical protein